MINLLIKSDFKSGNTFASYLTIGGVNLRTVQTLLGHKDLRVTMRYSHLSPEHLKETIHNLDKAFNSIGEGLAS
jgi:site-specific recombinase XerC